MMGFFDSYRMIMGWWGGSVVVPSVPGLEWTLPASRLHYALAGRLDYTLAGRLEGAFSAARLEWTLPGQLDFTLPEED